MENKTRMPIFMASEIILMALASAVRQEKAMRGSKTGEEKMNGLSFVDEIHWIQRMTSKDLKIQLLDL